MPAASSNRARRAWGFAEINSPIRPCPIIEGERAPVDTSANSSCTSLARTSLPLMRYTEPASRSMRRDTCSSSASLNAAGASRSALSRNSATSAILRDGRAPEPEKITSSIEEARMFLYEFSPITQRSASTRLDLPQPFGPTTPVRPFSMTNSVGSTKDLKPKRRSLLNSMVRPKTISNQGSRSDAIAPKQLLGGRLYHYKAASTAFVIESIDESPSFSLLTKTVGVERTPNSCTALLRP